MIGFISLNVILLKCVSMSNQECKVRPALMGINSNPLIYHCNILVNKCCASCNNISDPYAK